MEAAERRAPRFQARAMNTLIVSLSVRLRGPFGNEVSPSRSCVYTAAAAESC